MSNTIKTNIQCENLAPLEKLSEEFNSGAMKIAVLANNGSGKTFLSRMFRLLEKNQPPIATDVNGKVATDKLITFEKKSCSFAFKVTQTQPLLIKEDIKFTINKGAVPVIPQTNYIYHCFNEDYVDENIQTLSFDKESNVVGFILGKTNIDVSNEETELTAKVADKNLLAEKTKTAITKFINEKIGTIPNINRLTEFRNLNYDKIANGIDDPWTDVNKTYDELISDYNKIKSVPENLSDIGLITSIDSNLDFIKQITDTLEKEFSLGSFAAEFKQKIKSKQAFVEAGLTLIKDDNNCPFCEQTFDLNATNLIDQYNKFIQDEEAQTIKRLNSFKDSINAVIKLAKAATNETNKVTNEYNDFKTKYIPSLEKTELTAINTDLLTKQFGLLLKDIDKKSENISLSTPPDKKVLDGISLGLKSIALAVSDNNKKVQNLNDKKNSIGEENKSVRRDLCKVVYNSLITTHKSNFQDITKFEAEILKLQTDIKIKKEQQKISKKDKVASTVKSVLKYFFAEKYTLDEDTFRLVINKKILDEGQAKEVLSAGE